MQWAGKVDFLKYTFRLLVDYKLSSEMEMFFGAYIILGVYIFFHTPLYVFSNQTTL
jgi:hypothetical protein